MLQRVSRLQAVLGSRAAAPALCRSYGFGSHMNGEKIPTATDKEDNEPELIEKEKERHLKGQTVSRVKEAPGWSEALASDSEAVVKAEHCDDCPPEEMQRETVRILEEERKLEGGAATGEGANVEPKSGAMGA